MGQLWGPVNKSNSLTWRHFVSFILVNYTGCFWTLCIRELKFKTLDKLDWYDSRPFLFVAKDNYRLKKVPYKFQFSPSVRI